jgi:hypothetical protein
MLAVAGNLENHAIPFHRPDLFRAVGLELADADLADVHAGLFGEGFG